MTYLVSVIMATYNSQIFLLESINSIVNQTYKNWELLITDDKSTDGTLEILMKYSNQDSRIIVNKLESNVGPAIARNHSIKLAKGRFIAFCDSDDVWNHTKLEKQIKYMLKNNAYLCYTSFDRIKQDGSLIRVENIPQKVNYAMMNRHNYLGCLTVIYDRKFYNKQYMPELKKRQDWALWLLLLKPGHLAYGLNESLAKYRTRKKSIVNKISDIIFCNWSVYINVLKLNRTESVIKLIVYIIYNIFINTKLKSNALGIASDRKI